MMKLPWLLLSCLRLLTATGLYGCWKACGLEQQLEVITAWMLTKIQAHPDQDCQSIASTMRRRICRCQKVGRRRYRTRMQRRAFFRRIMVQYDQKLASMPECSHQGAHAQQPMMMAAKVDRDATMTDDEQECRDDQRQCSQYSRVSRHGGDAAPTPLMRSTGTAAGGGSPPAVASASSARAATGQAGSLAAGSGSPPVSSSRPEDHESYHLAGDSSYVNAATDRHSCVVSGGMHRVMGDDVDMGQGDQAAGGESAPLGAQQEVNPHLQGAALTHLCRELAWYIGIYARRGTSRLSWPVADIPSDGNCWWRTIAHLSGQDWHELKQRILFRAEELFPIGHPLRQPMWDHCSWLRQNGAWADSVAIMCTAKFLSVRISVVLPERVAIFEPNNWQQDWHVQLEAGHFTPCILLDSSDSDSDSVAELLRGGGAKKRPRPEADPAEAAMDEQPEEPDRVEQEIEYLECQESDDTVIVSVLRTRYGWHQALRGSAFGWRFAVRRGTPVETVRRAIARKLHIRRSAIFLCHTEGQRVELEVIDDNQVWTFEVHLDEAVPQASASASSAAGSGAGPPPTVSPTLPFEPPRPSVAPELQQPEEEAAEAEPQQEEEGQVAQPAEDDGDEVLVAGILRGVGRQRMSIELPSLYLSPPAAQRQRLRVPLHNIGPVYLIVEEGFQVEDFAEFGGLQLWQIDGEWHAYAHEPIRVIAEDRRPLTDDDDGMEDIRGGGRRCTSSLQTFGTETSPPLLYGGGKSSEDKASPTDDDDDTSFPAKYQEALEKIKKELVTTNLPMVRMLLRGDAALVRRVATAPSPSQSLQLLQSAAKRIRADPPVSGVRSESRKGGSAGSRPSRGRSVEVRTPAEEAAGPARRVVGKQPPPKDTFGEGDTGPRFGWVTPSPKPVAEVSFALITTEWSVPAAARLVAGRPGVAMIADKEEAVKQAKALRGGAVPMAIVTRAKYDELENFPCSWVAFSATKQRGDADPEKVALRGWLVQIGQGTVKQTLQATIPITMTSSDRTTTMAVDMHQTFTNDKVWNVVVNQHRLRMMRRLLGVMLQGGENQEKNCLSLLNEATTPGRGPDEDTSNGIVDCFRLSKAGQKASVMIRVPTSLVGDLVQLSGRLGIFLRPLDDFQDAYRVIWLAKDVTTLATAQDLQKDIEAVGLALSASGVLGLRVLPDQWETSNLKLGRPTKDPVYRVSGFPRDTTADMVEDLITSMQWHASLVPGGWRWDGQEGSWLLRFKQPPASLVQRVRWGEDADDSVLILHADKKPSRGRGPHVKVWSRIAKPSNAAQEQAWTTPAPAVRSRSVPPQRTQPGSAAKRAASSDEWDRRVRRPQEAEGCEDEGELQDSQLGDTDMEPLPATPRVLSLPPQAVQQRMWAVEQNLQKQNQEMLEVKNVVEQIWAKLQETLAAAGGASSQPSD